MLTGVSVYLFILVTQGKGQKKKILQTCNTIIQKIFLLFLLKINFEENLLAFHREESTLKH